MGLDSAGLEAIVVVPRTATCVAARLGLIVVLPHSTVSRHRMVAFVPETFNLNEFPVWNPISTPFPVWKLLERICKEVQKFRFAFDNRFDMFCNCDRGGRQLCEGMRDSLLAFR